MNKTLIAGIITVLAGVAAYFGIEIGEAEQQVLVESVSSIAAGVGVIVAAVGAYKTKKGKTNTNPAPDEKKPAD